VFRARGYTPNGHIIKPVTRNVNSLLSTGNLPGKHIEQKTFLRKSLSLFSNNPSSFIFISITMHKLSGLDCFGAMVHNNFDWIQGRIVFVFNWFSVFCFQLNMALVCYRVWVDIISSLLSPLLLRFWPCHTFLAQVAAAAASLYRPVCLGDV